MHPRRQAGVTIRTRQLDNRRKMIMMRKPMKALVATGALALATASGAGAVLATATPASADVLVPPHP
jgi:2-methylaconitate cis-trans-isomerase PrpF